MNDPTDEQIQEFWEWCGFKFSYPIPPHIINPDGETCDDELGIDLNNLFKYAVPKVRKELSPLNYGMVMYDWLHQFVETDKDPALALFWAIYEIIKGGIY